MKVCGILVDDSYVLNFDKYKQCNTVENWIYNELIKFPGYYFEKINFIKRNLSKIIDDNYEVLASPKSMHVGAIQTRIFELSLDSTALLVEGFLQLIQYYPFFLEVLNDDPLEVHCLSAKGLNLSKAQFESVKKADSPYDFVTLITTFDMKVKMLDLYRELKGLDEELYNLVVDEFKRHDRRFSELSVKDTTYVLPDEFKYLLSVESTEKPTKPDVIDEDILTQTINRFKSMDDKSYVDEAYKSIMTNLSMFSKDQLLSIKTEIGRLVNDKK